MTAAQEAKAQDGPSDDQRRTLWVGNVAEKVDEETLYELMVNAGPVESIKIPLDPVSKKQKNFAFVRFRHEESVVYAVEVFRDVRLFGKNLRMQNKDTGAGMPPPRPEWRPPPQDQAQMAQRQHQFNHHRSHSMPQDFSSFQSPLPVPAAGPGPYFNQGQMQYQQAQYQSFGAPPHQQQEFGHPTPMMLQRTVENNYFQGANQCQYPDQVARDRHFRESRYDQQHRDYQRSDSEGRNRSRRRDTDEGHYRERSWDRRQRY